MGNYKAFDGIVLEHVEKRHNRKLCFRHIEKPGIFQNTQANWKTFFNLPKSLDFQSANDIYKELITKETLANRRNINKMHHLQSLTIFYKQLTTNFISTETKFRLIGLLVQHADLKVIPYKVDIFNFFLINFIRS